MRNRRSQRDMAHSLTPDLRLDYLNTTLLTDNTAMLHALVFAAITFVILHRTENLCTEQAISFGLERPVIDGLRLLYFAERPLSDRIRSCERNPQSIETERILGFFEEVVEIAQGGCLLSKLVSGNSSRPRQH